jgi:hypothetical protein
MLDVPRDLIWFVSGLLAARRRETGTRKKTRKLSCCQQALSGLSWSRDRISIPGLGAGSGLPQATACRCTGEVTGVLAGCAPGLREAPERALAEGTPYVILDGKIADSDRCREKTVSRKGRETGLRYSGKRKDSGGNIQALFYPDGRPVRVSGVLPGNVNDLAAAKESVLSEIRLFADAVPALADGGYETAGHGVLTPVKKPAGMKEPGINARTRNALTRSVRCLGERGFALLARRWQTLRHITASPGKTGQIARAALVLVLFEHKMLA